MTRRVSKALAMYALYTAIAGEHNLPANHSHAHEYRDKVKTHCKGMSAEEMGTAHKRKSRKQRRLRK